MFTSDCLQGNSQFDVRSQSSKSKRSVPSIFSVGAPKSCATQTLLSDPVVEQPILTDLLVTGDGVSPLPLCEDDRPQFRRWKVRMPRMLREDEAGKLPVCNALCSCCSQEAVQPMRLGTTHEDQKNKLVSILVGGAKEKKRSYSGNCGNIGPCVETDLVDQKLWNTWNISQENVSQNTRCKNDDSQGIHQGTLVYSVSDAEITLGLASTGVQQRSGNYTPDIHALIQTKASIPSNCYPDLLALDAVVEISREPNFRAPLVWRVNEFQLEHLQCTVEESSELPNTGVASSPIKSEESPFHGRKLLGDADAWSSRVWGTPCVDPGLKDQPEKTNVLTTEGDINWESMPIVKTHAQVPQSGNNHRWSSGKCSTNSLKKYAETVSINKKRWNLEPQLSTTFKANANAELKKHKKRIRFKNGTNMRDKVSEHRDLKGGSEILTDNRSEDIAPSNDSSTICESCQTGSFVAEGTCMKDVKTNSHVQASCLKPNSKTKSALQAGQEKQGNGLKMPRKTKTNVIIEKVGERLLMRDAVSESRRRLCRRVFHLQLAHDRNRWKDDVGPPGRQDFPSSPDKRLILEKPVIPAMRHMTRLLRLKEMLQLNGSGWQSAPSLAGCDTPRGRTLNELCRETETVLLAALNDRAKKSNMNRFIEGCHQLFQHIKEIEHLQAKQKRLIRAWKSESDLTNFVGQNDFPALLTSVKESLVAKKKYLFCRMSSSGSPKALSLSLPMSRTFHGSSEFPSEEDTAAAVETRNHVSVRKPQMSGPATGTTSKPMKKLSKRKFQVQGEASKQAYKQRFSTQKNERIVTSATVKQTSQWKTNDQNTSWNLPAAAARKSHMRKAETIGSKGIRIFQPAPKTQASVRCPPKATISDSLYEVPKKHRTVSAKQSKPKQQLFFFHNVKAKRDELSKVSQSVSSFPKILNPHLLGQVKIPHQRTSSNVKICGRKRSNDFFEPDSSDLDEDRGIMTKVGHLPLKRVTLWDPVLQESSDFSSGCTVSTGSKPSQVWTVASCPQRLAEMKGGNQETVEQNVQKKHKKKTLLPFRFFRRCKKKH